MGMAVSTRNTRRDGGFSLIEALISSFLLLVIILGTLPLFTRAIVSVKSGGDSTAVATRSRGWVEELFQLPFDSPQLTVDSGPDKTIDQEYRSRTKQWVDVSTPSDPTDPVTWLRTATIRQYSVDALEDGQLLHTEALSAGTSAELIHIKEIVVQVRQQQGAAVFGPSRELTLRTIKSF